MTGGSGGLRGRTVADAHLDQLLLGTAGRRALPDASGPSPTTASLRFIEFLQAAFNRWVQRQFAHVHFAVSDPLRDTRERLQRLLKDLALSKEQQDVFERVVVCNSRFYEVAITGVLHGAPPWRRHIALNLALLRVYHTRLAAQSQAHLLSQVHAPVPRLSAAKLEDALRHFRWMMASYGGRLSGFEVLKTATEEELVHQAAYVAKTKVSAILASELHDASQDQDPLCPRFVLGLDEEHLELVLAVRGTVSMSDVFHDLIGDPVPFAGGMAHDGMSDGARRLLARVEVPLQNGVNRLLELAAAREEASDSAGANGCQRCKPRVVLTGHSLGAGVAELTAILLMGGDADKGPSDSSQPLYRTRACWRLPPDVELHTVLFAPPPVYSCDKECSDGDGPAAEARAAAKAAIDRAIGININYDIVPRTSLHNGYTLMQQARVVDEYIDWSQTRAVAMLRDTRSPNPVKALSASNKIITEIGSAIQKAASSRLAPASPFALQHPAAAQIFPIACAAGGTAAKVSQVSQVSQAGPPCPPPRWLSCGHSWQQTAAKPVDPHLETLPDPQRESREDPRSVGGWLYKRSVHVREWRRRYAWIEGGELCFARSPSSDVTMKIQLTAACTLVKLLEGSSSEDFPVSIVHQPLPSTVAKDGGGEASPCSHHEVSPASREEASGCLPLRELALGPAAPPWLFRVETTVAWNGHPATGCPDANSEAKVVLLYAETAAQRDEWVWRIVAAIRAARRVSYYWGLPLPPEAFGREALTAEGVVDDHQVSRYEAALEMAYEIAQEAEAKGFRAEMADC